MERQHSKNNPLKEKVVKALAEKIKNSKTLIIVSIKGLPSKQFQMIKKSIRGHASVQVAKKNIMVKAIDSVGKDSILDLKKYVQESSAFLISDMEGYELAGILIQKKNPINAKAGQIAVEDIEVKARPTDLVPGPAISELGAVGLQVSVEGGKLTIKNSKVIVKKDEKISAGVASILQKLDIQPFSVGLEPIAIFDVEHEKIYTNINIDPKEAAENLRNSSRKALGFAQKIVYYCKETIGYLFAKANAEGEALKKLEPTEKKEEVKNTKEKTEEETNNPQTTKPSEKPMIDIDKDNADNVKQNQAKQKSEDIGEDNKEINKETEKNLEEKQNE